MLFGKLGRLLGSLECLGWVLPEALVTSMASSGAVGSCWNCVLGFNIFIRIFVKHFNNFFIHLTTQLLFRFMFKYSQKYTHTHTYTQSQNHIRDMLMLLDVRTGGSPEP